MRTRVICFVLLFSFCPTGVSDRPAPHEVQQYVHVTTDQNIEDMQRRLDELEVLQYRIQRSLAQRGAQ